MCVTLSNRLYGNARGLTGEVQYLRGSAVGAWSTGPRRSGAVVLDVVEGPLNNPSAIYDYKFGLSTWGSSRIGQIRSVANLGPTYNNIYEIKP